MQNAEEVRINSKDYDIGGVLFISDEPVELRNYLMQINGARVTEEVARKLNSLYSFPSKNIVVTL